MKIQHKQRLENDPVLTVLEESTHWYLVQDENCSGAVVAFSKDRYAPVPEEQWEDVTADCTIVNNAILYGYKLVQDQKDCRLVFVQVAPHELYIRVERTVTP